MSRKTTRWRELARQAGEEKVHLLKPHRATGRARFRNVELDDVTLERAFGKVCCRPMNEEKAARFDKIVASVSAPKKKW